MNASNRSVFHFDADANPIGGQITLPVQQLLPSQGSASLAQAGGHASGRTGPHRVDSVVSFECAHSEVYGFQTSPRGPWTTTMSSVVEGLNILDIVRADAIVAKIKVTHPHGSGHPSVSFGGTHFYNLTVAGREIHPVLDIDAFSRTEEQAKKHGGRWESDERYLNTAMEHNRRLVKAEGAPQWIKNRYDWMTDAKKQSERGHVVCSLVTEIPGALKGSAFRHILHVPEVGNLFLGEISVSHGVFRVTMLRADMGCQADGDLSAGSGGVGGMMMAMDESGGGSGMPGQG